MRLQIPYNEFEQLLNKYFQQKLISQINLAYVDESTIQVSAVVKIKLKVMEASGNRYWNCVRMLLKTCWRYKTIIQC